MTNGNSAERERFEYARSLLPNEMYWGEPITVAAVLHIADAALSVCADGGKGDEIARLCGLYLDDENEKYSARSIMLRILGLVITAPQAECAPRVDADTATCQNCNGTGSHGGRFHIDDKGSSEYEPYKCDVCDGFGRVSADAEKDAAPVAWRYFDGEGNYEYRDDAPSESSIYHAAIYGRKFESLYLAAPTPERADAEKDAALTSKKKVGEFVGYQKVGFQQFPIISWNCHVPMGAVLYTDASADPTDPGYDAEVLREQVRHLERRIRELSNP